MSRHGAMWHSLLEAPKWLDVEGSAVIRHYLNQARSAAQMGDLDRFDELIDDARSVQRLRDAAGMPHPGRVDA